MAEIKFKLECPSIPMGAFTKNEIVKSKHGIK